MGKKVGWGKRAKSRWLKSILMSIARRFFKVGRLRRMICRECGWGML